MNSKVTQCHERPVCVCHVCVCVCARKRESGCGRQEHKPVCSPCHQLCVCVCVCVCVNTHTHKHTHTHSHTHTCCDTPSEAVGTERTWPAFLGFDSSSRSALSHFKSVTCHHVSCEASVCWSVLECVGVCWSVLECVAVC